VTPAQVALIARYVRLGEDYADVLGVYLTGYVRQFERLAVLPADVHDYLLWEQRVLGSLYAAAREPVVSRSRIQDLALRLAVDPRRTPEGHRSQYVVDCDGEGVTIGKYPGNETYSGLFPPADQWSVHPVFVVKLLRLVYGQEGIHPQELVDFVEAVFHGAPREGLTIEGAVTARLTYSLGEDRVRLWVMGQEVKGIDGRYEQIFLRLMCPEPTISCTGPQMKTWAPGLKNPSSAAKKIRTAMKAISPEASHFLQTNPFRWADGIVPMPAGIRGSAQKY